MTAPTTDTTTSPSLRLSYFNYCGRAEYIRLALVVGGVPFEDRRLTAEEQAAMKAGTAGHGTCGAWCYLQGVDARCADTMLAHRGRDRPCHLPLLVLVHPRIPLVTDG